VRALDARKEEPTLCAAIRTQPLHANGRYSPKSDHLLRCHEMTLWAKSDQSAAQQIAMLPEGRLTAT
jgi:hypothetical protein